MGSSPTLPRCPLPPDLRVTAGKQTDGEKDVAKPTDAGDKSSSGWTSGMSVGYRPMSLRFASGTNQPTPCHVPLRRRAATVYRSNDEENEPKASESGEEGGNRQESLGTGQENERPTSTASIWPTPALQPISPREKTMSARDVKNGSKGHGAQEEAASSSICNTDHETSNPNIPPTPKVACAVLENACSNSNCNRSPSPRKRKHVQREETLDSEYRRDLLTFEGIHVRDSREEADARAEVDEESPRKKGKTIGHYEPPDQPLVLDRSECPPGDHLPVRNLRAQVIAQTGFATHFQTSVCDSLDEEDLFAPEVDHIEQDNQHPVIIPIRDGSRAQYPAGSTADRVGVQLGERRRRRMIAARALSIREKSEQERKRRECLAAKAAAEAHHMAVAHAAVVANNGDEEAVATDTDEREDEDLGDLALHRCPAV